MTRIFALTVLTFKEGVRDRALYGISFLAVMMLLATILFTNLFGHELGKVMVDLCLSTIAFSGLLLSFFINVNLMAKDIDKLTIYSVLSRPISRTEYVIGKYLGLVSIVVVSLFILLLISAGTIMIIKGGGNVKFFSNFSWTCYLQAFFYEILMFLILNAVIIFFSTITSSSFLTLIFSLSVYVTGQTMEEVVSFFKKEAVLYKISSPVNEVIVNYLQYVFPNLSAFDIKNFASHGKLVSSLHTVSLTGYAVFYSMLLIFFSIMIFKRRELK